MKIASFTDKQNSAIDRLAMMTKKRLPHLHIRVASVHPKRPSEAEINEAREMIRWCDIIHFEYWKTAVTIRKLLPECEGKKMILTHQNEHNIEGGEWGWEKLNWDVIVAKNGWQKNKLELQGFDPKFIKHAIEFDNFSYVPKLTEEKIVLYVGQIKKCKGVRELKKACDELGYRLMVVGSVSEGGYWEELDKNNLMFHTNVPDNELGALYHKARVYVANSVDGTESGTLPILEAMASGVPVISRKIGHVRDFGQHMKNIYIRDGEYTDIEDLKKALKMVMENDDIANDLRENAWRTVRQYHADIQAREYNLLYHKTLYPDNPIVSIIMPTYNRGDVLLENIEALEGQSYKNFELVVCDDNSDTDIEALINDVKYTVNFPIRYVNTKTEGYGLAKARNLGVIEAVGEILVFCDDRLKMHPAAIKNFVEQLSRMNNPKSWVWGSKGVFKSFVENFSATYRRSLILGGMFNERIDSYGGMTQEVSGRFGSQGFTFDFCPQALATPMVKTHSKSRNRQSIINQKIRLYKMGLQ